MPDPVVGLRVESWTGMHAADAIFAWCVSKCRSFMSDPETKWRFGEPPSYDVANLEYMKGKSKNHPEGSWEQIVRILAPYMFDCWS